MIKGKCSEMTQQMSIKSRNYTKEASRSSRVENYKDCDENLLEGLSSRREMEKRQ